MGGKRTGKARAVALTTAQPSNVSLLDAPSPVLFRRATSLENPTFTRQGSTSEMVALGIDYVYACVRTIADAISGAAVNEWRGIDPLPASRLARRPMQSATRREWLWKVTATLALYNSCPLVARGGEDSEGVPWSLVPIAPPRLSWVENGPPMLDGHPISPDSLRIIRRSVFPSLTADQSYLLRLAQETFATADAAGQYAGDYWQSGGSPLVLLKYDKDMSTQQLADTKNAWIGKRAEAPGSPAILTNGLTAERFGADLGTEQADVAMDSLGASIARFFGVPPALINVKAQAGSLTYSTTESQGVHFVRYTLSPYAGAIGDALSDYLPGDYIEGRRIELDLSHLTRAEQASRYQSWESALRAGWLSKDEVRRAEGYATVGATGATAPLEPEAEGVTP